MILIPSVQNTMFSRLTRFEHAANLHINKNSNPNIESGLLSLYNVVYCLESLSHKRLASNGLLSFSVKNILPIYPTDVEHKPGQSAGFLLCINKQKQI
jgi:hypothetical protein